MVGIQDLNTEMMSNKLEETLNIIKKVNQQFKNPVINFHSNHTSNLKNILIDFYLILGTNYVYLCLHSGVFITLRNGTVSSGAC